MHTPTDEANVNWSSISPTSAGSGSGGPAGGAAGGVVIVSKIAQGAARAWWDGCVAPSWPDEVTPEPAWLSWEAATTDRAAFEKLRVADASCVLVDPTCSEAEIRALCACVTEHSGAGVCVLPASHAHLARAIRSMGMLVHHDGRSHGCLGSMLLGMTDRQGTVRDLEIELRARRAAQRQVHQWVSKVDGELLLAAKLQREVMKSDDFRAPGLRIAIMYRPAWYVSGDVYKLLRVDEQHVGLVLADAMGHGVSAAMYSMLIANSTTMKQTSNSGYRVVPPHQSMDKLNSLLLQPDAETTRFASAVCGLLNLRSGELSMSSAGHPTALVVGERVTRLESTGPVLGVFDDATFGQDTATMHTGDTLAVYTDGLECVVGDNKVEEFLVETIRANAGNPEAAIASIENHLNSRPGSLAPKDDITVVLVMRE